ncbi:MAG: ParB/RepB/Spo0J family partition protein [Bacillota bacterium]
MVKENRLGKGLNALLSDSKEASEKQKKGIENIYIENIVPNPFQPRKEFDRDSLEELANSIKSNGIIQPITVRQAEPKKYQIVSGERRWRAAKLIGMKKIPAIVNDYNDNQMMEVALIENLQREDLNPIEEAQAYKRMLDDFDMTQKDVAEKVGKSRSSIANTVRLLNLTPKVQMYVSRETLSMGHARSLLSLDKEEQQVKAADYIIKNHLSVRETEKYISNLMKTREEKKDKQKSQTKNKLSEKWVQGSEKIAEILGKEVQIKPKKGKKVITIECEDYQDLNDILEKINK